MGQGRESVLAPFYVPSFPALFVSGQTVPLPHSGDRAGKPSTVWGFLTAFRSISFSLGINFSALLNFRRTVPQAAPDFRGGKGQLR